LKERSTSLVMSLEIIVLTATSVPRHLALYTTPYLPVATAWSSVQGPFD
jgi:hypothetical protein